MRCSLYVDFLESKMTEFEKKFQQVDKRININIVNFFRIGKIYLQTVLNKH